MNDCHLGNITKLRRGEKRPLLGGWWLRQNSKQASKQSVPALLHPLMVLLVFVLELCQTSASHNWLHTSIVACSLHTCFGHNWVWVCVSETQCTDTSVIKLKPNRIKKVSQCFVLCVKACFVWEAIPQC